MQKQSLAKVIDGKAVAQDIRTELKSQIQILRENKAGLREPGLAVILVGDDPASSFYVNKKQESCTEVGIASFKTIAPATTTKEELINIIERYNTDNNVDGILLQLPLPKAIREHTQEIIDHIQPNKDVDGLTSYNLGLLMVSDHNVVYPCTPKGCMELLKRSGINPSGKKALVIGRSTLVGKPISLMLNQANATVTMAHSRTENLEQEIGEADILIAAIGSPEFIKGSWLKPGAVVIDVGINSVEKNGQKAIVGDVEYNSALNQASYITPVPGGVGPMTVAMLLTNCFELYKRHLKAQ